MQCSPCIAPVQTFTDYADAFLPASHLTPPRSANTAYLGETGQVSTVTALGQTVSGGSGLTTYGYLPNTADRRLSTITYNAAAAAAGGTTSYTETYGLGNTRS